MFKASRQSARNMSLLGGAILACTLRPTQISCDAIDGGKLPRPPHVVQELAVVVAVVVRGVALRVVGGREGGGLVPVDGVELEEHLHALCDLLGSVPAPPPLSTRVVAPPPPPSYSD